MKFKSIQHIFFDLDHTLWDFDKNSEAAFEAILKKHNFPFSTALFLEHYIPKNKEYWKLYEANTITQHDLRYYRLKDVFDMLHVTISSGEIKQLSEEYIEQLPKSNHLFEGAIEILDYLQSQYTLHIITNGFHLVQDKKMKKANLTSYFTTITTPKLAGEKKPHAAIFEYALANANATKAESLMIGDSLDADIKGALNFGIEAIFFNPEKIKTDIRVNEINHLLELKKTL